MNIYQSEYLNISHQGETLIQSWTDKNLKVEDYKHELSNFMDIFYQVKPKELVMDIKKCNLVIPEELDGWMAEKALIPISKKGIKKLALTVADDIAVHLSIVASLEKAKPILQSAYFSCLNEVSHQSKNRKESKSPALQYQLNSNLKSIDSKVNIDFNDLPKFLKSMKQIEADNQFVQNHLEDYYALTIREIEVFKLMAFGRTNKQIAHNLFIEESSVKTHRKNIKKKLKITSHFDTYQYARCFNII